MKRKVSVFALTLALVCVLSMALNMPLVQADAGGTGKYLTINIVGEGYVNATKVNSGETWSFTENGTEKVGAGTIELKAFASSGWEFSCWEGDLIGTSENPTDYKTVKYGYVEAVFVRQTFTIIASVSMHANNGTIDPVGNVTVQYGADQTFEFLPDVGNNTSTIVVDGSCLNLTSFAESYTFYNVTEDHTIEVFFSTDGTAFVPPGTGQTVFPTSGISLTFNSTNGGIATGWEETYYPVGALIEAYDIGVPFPIIGGVIIALHYDGSNLTEEEEENLRLIKGDSIPAILSDVDKDQDVDGTDVSIVANAVKQSDWYNPFLDINNDGYVNEYDLHIVNENKGTILVDITLWVDTVNDIIYGINYIFSPYIFGVR